jgi:hypothetical protein
MSFREKILWTTILSGGGPYLWYFGSVGLALASGGGGAALSVDGLVWAVLLGLIVMIVAVLIVAVLNRGTGSMMPDEREHRIESRGFAISYHILCTGILLTIGSAWLGLTLVVTIHLLAFAFILAELTRVAVELRGLRSGY